VNAADYPAAFSFATSLAKVSRNPMVRMLRSIGGRLFGQRGLLASRDTEPEIKPDSPDPVGHWRQRLEDFWVCQSRFIRWRGIASQTVLLVQYANEFPGLGLVEGSNRFSEPLLGRSFNEAPVKVAFGNEAPEQFPLLAAASPG